jgi:hypothetical protein
MKTRLSKRLRFEILRRDNHACRYCGRRAPDVQLTVDHVVPVALGGTDEPGNLVTACTECNGGKSASSPDASIVADVSADAIRWGRAIREAAAILAADYQANHAVHEQFRDHWNNWRYGYRKETLPLPAGWQQSVDSFLAAGLPIELLCESIDLAMARGTVTPDNTFRYMCGIAWKRVRELQDLAKALAETESSNEDAPDEPLPPPVKEVLRQLRDRL